MQEAADADPVSQLIIEMLARTGLRVGELCALIGDAVAKIKGSIGCGSRLGNSTTAESPDPTWNGHWRSAIPP